ncbi:retrovirus-related pol polyprotein from transposon TNT 1-94 [Tanacetum coccineum]
MRALLLLASLPASYEHFMDTLLYGREALTLEDVMATLNSKEIKEKSKAKGDDGEGLYVRGRTNHKDSRQSRGNSRSKSRGGRLKCYICQSEDHMKRNSLKNNRKKSTSYVKKDEQPSFNGSTIDDSKVGDNKEYKIRGIGKVRVQLKDGSSFMLHNVRYIPELKRNLISLGTLEKEGYTVKLQSGKVKVINGSRVILSGIRRDNCVYSLDGHAMAGELNASVEEKDSLAQVWHKRLGHISEAGLQVLEKQGLFGKKSLGKLDFYENYVLRKSYRVSFDVGRHTTQGVIDYVHSDLWGPSQVESLGGKRYFLSIVDDYSRRVWVYILRFKHEAFGKFKEWKQLVENQTGRTVKKLRTDNGLEFCNREFEQLCIESGIARHLTVAGTPQQNGVAERMNRTLMDKVRCLLIQSGLPKTFWAEATCTAAYLINRSPSRAIEKKTPMEMWSGHPSDYGMQRILHKKTKNKAKRTKPSTGMERVQEIEAEDKLELVDQLIKSLFDPCLAGIKVFSNLHPEWCCYRWTPILLCFSPPTVGGTGNKIVNRIDVIDVSCEEYAQEVLGFLDISKSGNPTPSLDPIISTSFPSLTPFEGGNFILEEIKACLTNDSIPPRIDDGDFDR